MKYGIIKLILSLFLLVNSNVSGSEIAQFDDKAVEFLLPKGWALGEVAAIKETKNGNFIVFHRGQHQLIEFDKNMHDGCFYEILRVSTTQSSASASFTIPDDHSGILAPSLL